MKIHQPLLPDEEKQLACHSHPGKGQAGHQQHEHSSAPSPLPAPLRRVCPAAAQAPTAFSSICKCPRRIYSSCSPRGTCWACPLPRDGSFAGTAPQVPGTLPQQAHPTSIFCAFRSTPLRLQAGLLMPTFPFPISHLGIICIAQQDDWGWGTDVYHQPFKAKNKISPAAPSTAP